MLKLRTFPTISISILALQQTLGVGLKTVEKILSLPDIQEPTSPHDLIEIIRIATAKYNRITVPNIKHRFSNAPKSS